MLAAEADESNCALVDLAIDGYTAQQLGFHCWLLVNAGLAASGNGEMKEGDDPYYCTIFHLTWAGYEFLDNARNESRWKTVMDKLRGAAGSVSVSVVSQALGELAKN